MRAEQSEFLARVLSLIVEREKFADLGRAWRLREAAALALEAERAARDHP